MNKRAMSFLLALVMVVTSFAPGLTSNVFAANGTPYSDVEMIAGIYHETDVLTDEEAALIAGLVDGESGSYVAPESADVNITVDVNADPKTITAEVYEDSEGNSWYPAYAEVSVAGEWVEDITFETEDDEIFVGEYTGEETSFSVKVLYVFAKKIAKADQLEILNTPGVLKEAYDQMEIAVAAKEDLDYLMDNFEVFENLASGAYISALKFQADAQAAFGELSAQKESNDGYLNIQLENDLYTTAGAIKMEYL